MKVLTLKFNVSDNLPTGHFNRQDIPSDYVPAARNVSYAVQDHIDENASLVSAQIDDDRPQQAAPAQQERSW